MGTVPDGIRRVKGKDSPDPKRANVVKEAFSLPGAGQRLRTRLGDDLPQSLCRRST